MLIKRKNKLKYSALIVQPPVGTHSIRTASSFAKNSKIYFPASIETNKTEIFIKYNFDDKFPYGKVAIDARMGCSLYAMVGTHTYTKCTR